MADYFDLLLEGGLGGHMSHLYENGDLTFAEIKDVFKQGSKGKLQGTEKTDGQNIKLSFSVKRQAALGARNATQIKQGGLSKQEMVAFFADHPNPNLKLAFGDAIAIFEKAVKLLDVDKQVELFGSNADIWYNAEVMDDRTRNVVNYDTRNLLIHRTGHALYDKATGKIIEDDSGKTDKKATKFMNFLEKVQNKVSNKRHAILVNPIQNLQALSNKEALRTAIIGVEQVMAKYGLNDSNTINDLLRKDLNARIKTRLPEEIKMKIISNFLDIGPKVGKKELKKGLSPELQSEVDKMIESGPVLMKEAIRPIEMIVTDFAAEMLKTLNSIFILDNKKETERLSQEVQAAIQNIESSGKKGDLDFLNRQLEKLKGVDTISSAVEGFAFSYKGHLYKFTGKFAPVNQILGLSKYGRGSKGGTEELTEVSSGSKKYDIALLGGGFKPPHKGHIELIKQLSTKADEVVILTSNKSSKDRKFNSGKLKGQVIDGAKSNKILEEMLSLSGLSNVRLKITSTPLKDIFDYVKEQAQYGETILLGVGDKEDDAQRFANIQKYVPENSNIRVDVEVLKPISFGGTPLSASRMREIISNGNLKQLIDFIPNEVANKTNFAQLILDTFLGEQINESQNIVNLKNLAVKDQELRNVWRDWLDQKGGWSEELVAEFAAKYGTSKDDLFNDAPTQAEFKTIFSMLSEDDFRQFTDDDWDNFHIIVQHMDKDINIQKKARDILKRFNRTSQFEYLDDRINCAEYGQQLYGTQNGCKKVDKIENISLEEIQEEVFKLFTEDNINEMSAAGAGAIAGAAGPFGKIVQRKKKMKEIKREQFMEELQLRKMIRKALVLREEKKKAVLQQEQLLRKELRKIIREAKQDFNYGNTGLNKLGAFLQVKKPLISSEYKQLQTDKTQRDAFKARLLQSSKELFDELEAKLQAGKGSSEPELEEEINVSIDEPVDDKLLPGLLEPEKEKKPKKDKEAEFKVEPTGEKEAAEFFESYVGELTEIYTGLDNPTDRQMFRDYYMSNVAAIMDQAEAEAGNVAKPVDTTPPEGAQQTTSEPTPDQQGSPAI
jgi:cytidyltransferase-like protein